jgi:hypothetical protein
MQYAINKTIVGIGFVKLFEIGSNIVPKTSNAIAAKSIK